MGWHWAGRSWIPTRTAHSFCTENSLLESCISHLWVWVQLSVSLSLYVVEVSNVKTLASGQCIFRLRSYLDGSSRGKVHAVVGLFSVNSSEVLWDILDMWGPVAVVCVIDERYRISVFTLSYWRLFYVPECFCFWMSVHVTKNTTLMLGTNNDMQIIVHSR